jgi:hypothetical protein
MLSAHDFAGAAGNPLFWRLIGASAAVAVGVLVNDSGASFLALGAVTLGAFLAFSWAQRQRLAGTETG